MTNTHIPLHNNNYNNYYEKTKEPSPMFTVSSSSPDTTVQSRLSISKSFPSSSLRRIGTIKLLILTVVIPIMILTIINPMWICIFMKYPHVNRNILTKIPAGEMHHVSKTNAHTDNLSSIKPQMHTHTKSYKGGIKVTQETLDIIVASKDGRLQELETTITVIENIPPSSKNHRHNKQISQHDNNKKETTNFKAHAQINKPLVTSEIKNNDESIIDKFRKRLFKDRNSCAYVALSVITLCAVTICGIVCLSSNNRKIYEPVNNDDDENQPTGDHYVRVEDYDGDEKLNENNVAENKSDPCVIDCTNVQIFDNDNINTPTSSPPPYSSSNTNHELISTTPEDIQQLTNEN